MKGLKDTRLPAFGTALDWRRHIPFMLWMTLGGVPLLWYVYGPHGVPVELMRKTWQRDIVVERYQQELESNWCDRLPEDAQIQSRKMVKDPTGERRDMAEHCRYLVMQWSPYLSLRTEGRSPVPPRWANSALGREGEKTPGAQRLGPRHERYEVLLQSRADADKQWTCRLPQHRWDLLAEGLQFRLAVDRWGVADCRSLPLPPENGGPP